MYLLCMYVRIFVSRTRLLRSATVAVVTVSETTASFHSLYDSQFKFEFVHTTRSMNEPHALDSQFYVRCALPLTDA